MDGVEHLRVAFIHPDLGIGGMHGGMMVATHTTVVHHCGTPIRRRASCGGRSV